MGKIKSRIIRVVSSFVMGLIAARYVVPYLLNHTANGDEVLCYLTTGLVFLIIYMFILYLTETELEKAERIEKAANQFDTMN